jgi:hypothetical protein
VLRFVPTFDQVKSIAILLKISARPGVGDETERDESSKSHMFMYGAQVSTCGTSFNFIYSNTGASLTSSI